MAKRKTAPVHLAAISEEFHGELEATAQAASDIKLTLWFVSKVGGVERAKAALSATEQLVNTYLERVKK